MRLKKKKKGTRENDKGEMSGPKNRIQMKWSGGEWRWRVEEGGGDQRPGEA